jgi:hypothetical protein
MPNENLSRTACKKDLVAEKKKIFSLGKRLVLINSIVSNMDIVYVLFLGERLISSQRSFV